MGRGGGQPDGRRRPRRRRAPDRFLWLAATLALPLVALSAFFAWQWVSQGRLDPRTGRVVGAGAASRIPATDWRTALVGAGVDRDGIRELESGLFVVTSVDSADALARKTGPLLGASASVEAAGNHLTIRTPSGEVVIRVETLATQDSGLGLTHAEAVPLPGKSYLPAGTRIVLILDDVGFDRQALERAAAIDPNIAFAIIPSAARAGWAADWLAAQGREILCHLPMSRRDGLRSVSKIRRYSSE